MTSQGPPPSSAIMRSRFTAMPRAPTMAERAQLPNGGGPVGSALQERRIVIEALFHDLAAGDLVHRDLGEIDYPTARGERDAAVPLDHDRAAVGHHRAGREGSIGDHAPPHRELLLDRFDPD